MADLKMNQLLEATDANHVYAEDASGNQVRVKKKDLLDFLFQDRGSVADANLSTKTGIYRVDDTAQNISYKSYGVLLTLKSGYIVQVYICDISIQVRKSSDNGVSWTSWRSIILT